MSDSKITKTDWEPVNRLIITQISGEMEKADVIRWEQSLHDALPREHFFTDPGKAEAWIRSIA